MKLVSFSPWQRTTTSIQSSKNSDDILHDFIISPSSASPPSSSYAHPSKRSKLSKQSSSVDALATDMQPVVTITSNHEIGILGHESSRKILRVSTKPSSPSNAISEGVSGMKSNGNDDNSVLKQVPQWLYSSRPGTASAFFPASTNSKFRKIGAVVDATSRTVFALQKNNRILKVWGLDDDVNGPDDGVDGVDGDSSPVQKVQLDSPVLCMNQIPIKRQVRVKIKSNAGSYQNDEKCYGGVAGLLMNGQMFVVLVRISTNNLKTIKVGIFGNKSKKSTEVGSFLQSVIGFTVPTSKESTNEDIGQKRKLSSADDCDGSCDEWGEIVLTVLSSHAKNDDCISFTKHTTVISSFTDTKNHQETQHKSIDGSYTKQTGNVKLPHSIIDSHKSLQRKKEVLVSQLDSTHVSLVYRDTDKMWYTTILDTRYGECVIKPFPIGHQNTLNKAIVTPDVVNIGGLSTSILAVLTSDDILTIFDVRRAVKLHKIDIRKVLVGKEQNGAKYHFALSTHWFTGTIGISWKVSGGKSNGKLSSLSFSCARVGVYDADQETEIIGVGKKPFVKGSYNLARIISSTLATTNTQNVQYLNPIPHTQAMQQDMTHWFSQQSTKNSKSDKTDPLHSILNELESFRLGSLKQNWFKKTTFHAKFKEMVTTLNKGCDVDSRKNEKKISNKNPTSSSSGPSSSLPQVFLDKCLSIAMSIIFSQKEKKADKISAALVLIQCIESGSISGRIHFEKARISGVNIKGNVFRKLLLLLKAEKITTEEYYLPLALISSLLQHCKDDLSEQILVSMVHFILCHVNDNEFEQIWNSSQSWHSDAGVKVLEKRLKKAQADHTKNTEDRQKLVDSLEDQFTMRIKLFFIERVVCHSKCNPALLRASIQNGLTQTNAGEVEVLILVLGKLLRRIGSEKKSSASQYLNKSVCVSQWLSALVDTNLHKLLLGDDPTTINRVQKEVTASISQTRAILSLKELFHQMDNVMCHDKVNENNAIDMTSVPLYGIEPLIF